MKKFKQFILTKLVNESHLSFVRSPIIFYALFVETEYFNEFEKELCEIINNNIYDNNGKVIKGYELSIKYYPPLATLKEDLFEVDHDDPAINIIKRYCLETNKQNKVRMKLFVKSYLKKENYKFTREFTFYQSLFHKLISSFPTTW